MNAEHHPLVNTNLASIYTCIENPPLLDFNCQFRAIKMLNALR